ncbi:MAG: elongation factor 4 [Candidatus Pacebacteria bacterium CG_4_10_14_0_8_um_filter_43_12]|nr:MAG: elongation factor 4 [Candidatus Pacebacteria bacterium CG_4_10_14_0_8_um_filter_43_12]
MFSQEKIRNFCIIAHIDHGKTTLTDRFLRLTQTVTEREFTDRVMDSNPIERERGITIKLAPVRMQYQAINGSHYILNLIDTPGHVDFGYEVSRSLASCEGALLVVDATQGIQAQTLSTYQKAKNLGLTIIPVINKIDLPSADVDKTVLELMEVCHFSESELIQVSAKTGQNIQAVLEAVVQKVSAPAGLPEAPLRALLITSLFDTHRGAVALVRVIDGQLKKHDKLQFYAATTQFLASEVGVYTPLMANTAALMTGEVGFVVTGLKDARTLKVGDTIVKALEAELVKPLPGFKEPQPLVYLELYPVDQADFPDLQDSMSKLLLRDAAIQYSGTYSQALGSGLRVGFLGILHAEIVLERLQREFDLELIATAPSVVYQVTKNNGEVIEVNTPAAMPDPSEVREVKEPIATVLIFSPEKYTSALLQLCQERRGELQTTEVISSTVKLTCLMPLAELITDFHDTVKSLSSGFASVEYSVTGSQPVEAVTVTILLNHEPVSALSFVTVKEKAQFEGRQMVDKLKKVIPRQMFELPIQAAIGGTVIARETLQAYRKDVTAKLYGGDVSRRKKLLSKQAKGKKRMKQFGKVELDQQTFLSLLRRG